MNYTFSNSTTMTSSTTIEDYFPVIIEYDKEELNNKCDIENGKTNIGLDIFMRITETLQVSADWLLLNDTPHANAILDNEVVKLLDGCSTSEKQSIIKMISEFKNALHSNKE